MRRREFLKGSMTAGGLLLSGGLLISCARNMRTKLMHPPMDSNELEILYYASLAPSGHNSQPWSVRLLSATEWIIEADMTRRLTVVDPGNREVMLSMGAFIENLTLAAGAAGFMANITILAQDNFDEQIARVVLEKTTPQKYPLRRLALRRTLRSDMLPKELSKADVSALMDAASSKLYYFPRSSHHADLMKKEAIDNFVLQTQNDNAQEELSRWIRFKNADIEKHRDGLTAQSMEIDGIAGWYVRNFMKQKDVMSDSFRQKGIKKIIEQAGQGAGWMVITSYGDSAPALIEAGRRFQRLALIAKERNIAVHPMTQTLEEPTGQDHIKANHKPETIPQFMLRVGYVDNYPEPVTLRRPVQWFAKFDRNEK